jgi:hypothetical protein
LAPKKNDPGLAGGRNLPPRDWDSPGVVHRVVHAMDDRAMPDFG